VGKSIPNSAGGRLAFLKLGPACLLISSYAETYHVFLKNILLMFYTQKTLPQKLLG